jgi:hypothetical protein
MVSLEYEMKLEKFEHDIKDEKKLNKKLRILFSNEYDEILGDILNLKDELFIDQVKEGVSLLLEDHYTDSCLSDDRLSKLLEDNINEIKSKYKHDYALINKAWVGYDKISKRRSNNESLLSGFRKHCIYTDERASHNCCSNEKDGERISHFIIVNDSDSKKGIKFVVCENCKKVYYSSFILARCYKCNVDYYTSLLSKDENPEFLLATWENYHCPIFINEKMKCIKCHEHFYINMKTGLLTCLNKKCEFVSKPKKILWTCSICKTEFICGAIPYNPLDAEVTRRLVSQTILLKHKAHPNKMPCCKLNVYFTDFYHKQNCRGLLYESELDDNTIIVCEKCKAINYYDRFQWTCPKCGKKFRDSMIFNSNVNSETNINSSKERKSDKKEKERDKREKEVNTEEKEDKEDKEEKEEKEKKKINTLTRKDKKEKEIIENKKIMTPKPVQYISRRLGMKKENELKDFKLNNEKGNIIEEDEENERKKAENVKKFDSGRKYRRFHFNSIGMNEDDKHKDKNEENNKNDEKEKEKEKNKENNNDEKEKEKLEEKNVNEETNNIEEENEDNNYRKNRSRTTYNKIEKKEEPKRVFRRFRFERDKKDKVIEEKGEEKEKIEEKEKTEEKEENISPRMQWRKRYKRGISKEINKEKVEMEKKELEERERKEKEEKEKKEIEERERKEKEEREKKEKEEKEKKEKEEREKIEKEEREKREKEEKENELQNKPKEENLSGRGWFRRLAAAGKEKESTNKSSKKASTTTKSSKKEKELTIENEEESEEEDNDSINNNDDDEDNNELIKFGDNDSSSEDDEKENEKEEKENPMEPDSLLINIKVKRNQNKRKTRGMEIRDDQEEDNKEEEKSKKIIKKKKSVPQIKIAMSQIPGISEHLFNHIQKRMTSILNRCKIPIFNIEDYIFNKKLGEGSYAVIFSVYKNDDKEKKQLALKKIIAKTLTDIDKFTKEFELVHSCNHPNIMKIYGICIRMLDQTTYALYVLMELSYCDWDKEIKMHLMKKKSYKESELINILRQLTGALLFMQQNLKISHRDIKPQNVLLFGDGLYKIADFGEAKEAKLSKQVNTLRGTELYMSPALYSGLKNDRNDVNHDPYKSDVFSLGFCFFYAATLNFNILYQVREIYNSNRMNDILHQQLNKKYSQTFISILSHMMETDETDRFDFPHLVAFIDDNYDKEGNLKNPEKVEEKKPETIHRSINRKHK